MIAVDDIDVAVVVIKALAHVQNGFADHRFEVEIRVKMRDVGREKSTKDGSILDGFRVDPIIEGQFGSELSNGAFQLLHVTLWRAAFGQTR